MNVLLGIIIGLLAGLTVGWLLRPLLEVRAQKALPFLRAADVLAPGGKTLLGRIDAALVEIQSQINQGIDRDRNATRLQILREVKEGD